MIQTGNCNGGYVTVLIMDAGRFITPNLTVKPRQLTLVPFVFCNLLGDVLYLQ